MVRIHYYNEEEDVEEEQGQMLPQGRSPPIPDNPSEDFYRYRVDGNDILSEIKHNLQGEVYDYTKEKYVKKFDAWMNEEGINFVISILYSSGLNKGVYLGNLSKQEILHKCKMIKIKLARALAFDYRLYNLDPNRRSLLITSIINPVHSGLSRSEGGREGHQLSSSVQMHHIHSHNENAKKDNMFGRFMRPGK